MQIFTLIRHGESTGNVGEPYKTRGTPSLTTRGWQQARSLAAGFPASPSLIVASDMVRAQETAQPLRKRFPYVPFSTWPVHEFMPLPDHFYENMRQRDRKEQFYAFFESGDPYSTMQAHTESFAMGINRAALLLDRLPNEQGGIVVFTHATFLKMVYWTWLMGSAQKATETMAAFGQMQRVMPVANCSQIRVMAERSGQIYLTPPQA